MESDDDFQPPSQFARTQYRSSNPSQTVTSSSNQSQPRAGPSRPSQARQASSQDELSQIQDGLRFLMDRVQQLSGDSRGIKRPAEPKPFNSQPNVKQECQICHKLYANKTTLFRHYRSMHQEMNPERFHGCSVNSTIVSLDTSFREIQCSICGYIANTQTALEAHNRATHSNEIVANSNRTTNNNEVNVNSNVSSVPVNNDNVNEENINVNIKDKMHKCEECACYFEERSKFDEHMKAQHGFEVVCKICNKHLFFKDIDEHVKSCHPDVYNKKRKENNEKIIVEKVMKNRKGHRVRFFICTKCDVKMNDKVAAEKHARTHKNGLKIKTARNKISKSEENIPTATSNDNTVILTCLDCDISTGSYDAAIEHSQTHITNAQATFVTQLCEICNLKFEPLCYKKHIDLHYKDKEIHKESFKYFKYKYELLPSKNWFKCFDMDDHVVKKMINESIYEHTRIVKMRVLHEGKYKLYKCCKCDDYVEPIAVLNHTVNYDTCVKVKSSYPCVTCKRTFNNRLARNNHVQNHKRDEEYKIVLFNHVNDKHFNEVLKDFKLENTVERADTNNTNDIAKLVYKCLCGLCFMRKETADKHKRICPGKYDKSTCPKCNNLFTQEELVSHCFEHHLNETQLVIENITPDVIVIDSDEEIIEIGSSDDDDACDENPSVDYPNNIKIEVIRTDAATVPVSRDLHVGKECLNTLDAAVTNENVRNEKQMAEVAPVLVIRKAENDEDEETFDQEFGEPQNHEMTDEDSQDTIDYENTGTDTNVVNTVDIHRNKQELKLVPTNLLLNPLYYDNGLLKVVDIEMVNSEINADIENVRYHIETTDNRFDEISIKKEKSWLVDPTDFSNICRRPSLRQIQNYTIPSNSTNLEVESLLTDDEEIDINEENIETVNINIREDHADTSVPNEAATITEQSSEILNVTNNIIQNGILHSIEEERGRIEDNVVNAVTELDKEMHQLNSNNSTDAINKDMENEEDYSDDDLFLPSGIVMQLNNNENEIHKVTNAELVGNQESISEKRASDTNIVESETEEITGETELNKIARSDTQKQAHDIETRQTNESNNDEDNNDTNERQEETTVSGDSSIETQINADNINIPMVIYNKSTVETAANINKGFQFMDLNIKRELIAENDRDTENGCDIGDNRVQVKMEPNDILETYNENKENEHVVAKVEIENYNNCSIV